MKSKQQQRKMSNNHQRKVRSKQEQRKVRQGPIKYNIQKQSKKKKKHSSFYTLVISPSGGTTLNPKPKVVSLFPPRP
jgi:hypothetical protein